MFETVLYSDLQRPVQVEQLQGNLFSGDNGGNMITVVVTDNGEPVDLEGGVTAYIIRADGATVAVTGMVSGNTASVVLPASAYVAPGQVSIVVKVSTMTVGACMSYVYRSTTDTIIDPGDVVPSVDELLAYIEDCRSAASAIENMTAGATYISGTDPTVTVSTVSGHKHLQFGFPKPSATLISGTENEYRINL